jgi:hypothetical protein
VLRQAQQLAHLARIYMSATLPRTQSGFSLDVERALEGIISKKKHAPHKSGKCDRLKVTQWKEENRDRGDLFAGR